MTARIVACDGLVFDTLALRANAIIDACRTHDINLEASVVAATIAGQSFAESTRALVKSDDIALIDLIAMRAQRAFRERVAHGVDMPAGAHAWLRLRARAGVRMVLRSDSERADVEAMLRVSEVDMLFTFVRCADDEPRLLNVSSIESSYRAIASRLDALRESGERIACECSDAAREQALRHMGGAQLVDSAHRRNALFSAQER